MQPIANLIREPVKNTGPTSERAELIGYCTDERNRERKGTKYKPVTAAYIATKLSYLSKSDLYYLKGQAQDYRARHGSLSKYFFGALKPRQD